MNLYPDVHVRGLRLLGVGSGSDPEPRGAAGGPAGDVPPPAQVELGEPLPQAAWYRVR